jgi:serine/threonine protein kinase
MDSNDPNKTTVRGDTYPYIAPVVRALPDIPGYEVLELVGRGGMGRVYRARHLGLGRIVALKLLLQEADDLLLARFREETRAVARLQHPNIAQLYESGSADGRPYFAQEFLDGGSLAQALAGKPQPPREAAELVEIIARAVHHSHTQGILHRDLKPGNILLARKGEIPNAKSQAELPGAAAASGFRASEFIPKVADFGLAKLLENRGADTKSDSGGALTRTGEILGTPSYMPPEQASGAITNIGPTADVYALGAMLYEMLTGRPPFQSPDPVQTLMLVLTRDPVSPRTLQPDLPRDLETICLKCLEKSPNKRYESARELADDLHRYLDGRPITARPVGAFERAAKWARRNKTLAALFAVSLAAGVLLLGAGVALGVGYFKLKAANGDLETKNQLLDDANRDLTAKKTELEQTNAQLDQANKDVTAKKKEIENTLGLALASLDHYYFEFSDRLNELPGTMPLRLDVLRQARVLLDALAQFRPDDVAVENFRMTGYDRLGNLESAVGDFAAAERSYTKGRDIAARLEQRFPDEELYRVNRLLAGAKISPILLARGDVKAADAIYDAVSPEAEQLAAKRPTDPRVLELLSVVQLQKYSRLLRAKRWDDALTAMRELCNIYRRRAKVEPDKIARQRDVIDGDRLLAGNLTAFKTPDKLDEAGKLLERAAVAIDALPDRTSAPTRELRASVQSSLADYYDNRKEYAKSVAAYTVAVKEYKTLADQFADRPNYRYQEASTLYYLAIATSSNRDEKAAMTHLEKSEQLLAELVRTHKGNARYERMHSVVSDLLKKVRPKKSPASGP